MGAQMYELLALSVTAGFLAVIVGSEPDASPWARGLSMVFRVTAIALAACFVGFRATRDEGPFSPGLNFALVSSLVALGGWHAWNFLADTDGEVEEEADDEDIY